MATLAYRRGADRPHGAPAPLRPERRKSYPKLDQPVNVQPGDPWCAWSDVRVALGPGPGFDEPESGGEA